MLLRVLKARMGSVLMNIQNRLFSITNLQQLESLGDTAATCRSLDSFNKELKKYIQ